jgi:hypothetical protein
MTQKLLISAALIAMLLVLSACGRNEIRDECAEAKPHQSLVAGKRIVVPEGLDPLDEFREIPIPKAETAPRPDDARCIESPPAIQASS